MSEETKVRKVLKNIEYADLTVDEAIKMLTKIQSEAFFQGVGKELKDPKIPGWTLTLQMREALEFTLE